MGGNKEKNENVKKNVHSGHRQRMKYAVAQSGIEHLKDYQVLELILFYALPRIDTNPIAHELINEFGSLKGVLEAGEGELCKIKGIGKGAAELINFFRIVSLRYMYESSFEKEKPELSTTEEIRSFFENKFCGLKNEEIHVAAIDERCKLIGYKVISSGTNDKVGVNARLIVDFAVKCGGNKLVIAHNHPTGVCIPSKEDIVLTLDLVKTLEKLDINIFDHVIVGCNGSISMRGSQYGANIWKDKTLTI